MIATFETSRVRHLDPRRAVSRVERYRPRRRTIADTTFLASYDPAGAFLGQQLLDFPMGYVYINDSAIAPDGVLVISGVYQGTGVTLGGTVLPDNNLAGSGYVARLAP